MNGLSLVRRVYVRLRKPSQASLPWQTTLSVISDVIARKKLDLALSTVNSTARTSNWFTPTSNDIELDSLGLDGAVLIPTRIETRAVGSDYEIGDNVDIVSYEVMDSSRSPSAAFYGNPMRLAFRDTSDYLADREFRIVYEPDIDGELQLGGDAGLPAFFASMVVLEASYELLEIVDDDTPAWTAFFAMADKRWPMQIADKRVTWNTYVRRFRGRAAVPIRTFFDRGGRVKTKYFRG